jgi:hypothetical protein
MRNLKVLGGACLCVTQEFQIHPPQEFICGQVCVTCPLNWLLVCTLPSDTFIPQEFQKCFGTLAADRHALASLPSSNRKARREMDSATGDSLACFWDCLDPEGLQR